MHLLVCCLNRLKMHYATIKTVTYCVINVGDFMVKAYRTRGMRIFK